MDILEGLHSKLQSIVSKLIKTADDKEQLKQLRQQLDSDWAEYQRVVKELRPTLSSKEDIEELDEAVAQAVKASNLADQGITAKLEKLIEIEEKQALQAQQAHQEQQALRAQQEQQVLEAQQALQALQAQQATLKQEGVKMETKPTTPTSSMESTQMPALQVQPASQTESGDVKALHTLLQQITGQFNQIIAGNYPRPQTEPMLGAARSNDSDEDDNADDDASSPSKHRASDVRSVNEQTNNATTNTPPVTIVSTITNPIINQTPAQVSPAAEHTSAPVNTNVTPVYHTSAAAGANTNIPPAHQTSATSNAGVNTVTPIQPAATANTASPIPTTGTVNTNSTTAHTSTQECPANANVTADTIQQPRVELKMDKFSLPTFDGDLTNWLPFRDQFVDLVHNNRNYTAITKFIQLRGHLKGTALESIQGFKLSAANYEAAWYILQRRYNKPDQIVDEYLRKLTSLPPIDTPTTHRLITMVNCTNQILRVLPSLGVDVSNWDAIIKYSLTSKLDRTTYKKWLDQVKLRQSVPLQELIEFLEVEASENLPLPGRSYQNDRRKSDRPRGHGAAVLTTVTEGNQMENEQGHTNKEKCPQCKGIHPLFLCGTFKKLKVKDRINKVRSFKICARCLRKHEHQSDCKFGMCPTCTKDHNSMLCYKKERQLNESNPRVASLHSTPE